MTMFLLGVIAWYITLCCMVRLYQSFTYRSGVPRARSSRSADPS